MVHVILIGFPICVSWLLSLWVHPFGRCSRCQGKRMVMKASKRRLRPVQWQEMQGCWPSPDARIPARVPQPPPVIKEPRHPLPPAPCTPPCRNPASRRTGDYRHRRCRRRGHHQATAPARSRQIPGNSREPSHTVKRFERGS